jgi:hypothetical protein
MKGGTRPGAGRKKGAPFQKVLVSLPLPVLAKLEAMPGKTRTEKLINLINQQG